MMHVCPENYDPTHSWEECPTKYELGHTKELAARRKAEKAKQREDAAKQKEVEKRTNLQKKQEAKRLKDEEKNRKKRQKKKLREERLAESMPEFDRYCEEIGLTEDSSPAYLAELINACRGFLSRRRQQNAQNSGDRKRKREAISPPDIHDIIETVFAPPAKKQHLNPPSVQPASAPKKPIIVDKFGGETDESSDDDDSDSDESEINLSSSESDEVPIEKEGDSSVSDSGATATYPTEVITNNNNRIPVAATEDQQDVAEIQAESVFYTDGLTRVQRMMVIEFAASLKAKNNSS